ncbi:hypothetical protein GGF45_004557, partial [Coemansia sp. RSA 551]
MSMGNEAEQVAREHEDNPDGAHSSSADVLQASVGGEDDVDEMERWKNHWADDDSSDYTPDVDNEPLAVDSESRPAGVQNESDRSPKETSKEEDKDLTLEHVSDQDQDHDQNEEQDQVVPDTSRDAELARKLQHEFEQQVFEQ